MSTPFVDEQFTFTNPDGSTIQVKGTGDQFYADFETLDGYTVARDPNTGFFVYADLSPDKNDLVPTHIRVGQADPQTLKLRPHIRVRRESSRAKALQSPLRGGQKRRWQTRREEKKQLRAALSPTAAPETLPKAAVRVGNYVGLCVLVRFPDVAETISQAEVENFCNQQGYSGFGNNGSVRDYFFDNSRGKLTYTNAVTQYYTAQHDRAYYTDPAISYGTRAKELIREALNWLVGQGFNFSPLSADGSGYVYALNIFYAGPTVNNWSEGLWPHAWALDTAFNIGGSRMLLDYQITSMGGELTLRTFCHENGHMLCDYPDLYDYQYDSNGVGHYCLMCYGGDNKNPVQINAYLKNECGWATKATPLTPGMTATLSAANNDFYVYSKSASEYFIFENRQRAGRDAFLPDAGLAIWHIDESGNNSNQQMTSSQHYECSLVQADNRFDLEKAANYGDADDLFSAPNNTQFSDATTPSSKWWDGTISGLSIRDTSTSGATMTFNVPASIVWESSKAVLSTFTSPHSMNAWAFIEDVGWRKIKELTPDGVSNVFAMLVYAQAFNKRVTVYVDASSIHQAYLL